MPIKIMTTRHEENRTYLRVQCPVCEDIMEIEYEKTENLPVVCKWCKYIYPDLYILAKTIPPAIGLRGPYRLDKLSRREQSGFQNSLWKRKDALLECQCEQFDFLTT